MESPVGVLTIATAAALIAAAAAFYFLLRSEYQRFVIGASAIVVIGVAVALFWMPRTTPIPGVRFALAGFTILGWLLAAAYLEMRRFEARLSSSDAVLAELAGTEELTGLATRQMLIQQSQDALDASEPGQDRVSLIVVDVDNFRRLNDSFGTHAGDLILRAVASIVGNQARESDCAARIGSDEFALLLPETSLVMALQTAEVIRGEIARTRLDEIPVETSFTASIGVASLPPGIRDAESLLVSADTAVAEAKRKGRNQVCSSPDYAGDPAPAVLTQVPAPA